MSALFFTSKKAIITIASVRTAAVEILSFIPKRKLLNILQLCPLVVK